MGSTLRQSLKSLCDDSCWKYALLWKIRHGSPMILTWEDGYFGYPKPREPTGNMSNDDVYHGACDIFPAEFETSSSNGSCGGYQIRLVMADMSHLQYAFGEGVVGEVAFTGNHCWVSFNNIFSNGINPKLVPECPEEWLLQFASGFKTILLVPVPPHGVLQLGSFEEVLEDTEMVAHLKNRFNNLYSAGRNITLNREFKYHLPSPLLSNATEYLNARSTTTKIPVKSEDSYQFRAINCVRLDKENLPDGFKHENKNRICDPLITFPEVSSPSESVNSLHLEMVESKLFELSSLMEELQQYSECNDYTAGLFGKSFNWVMSASPSGDVEGKPTGDIAAHDANCKNTSSFLRFPEDSELHKALGSAFCGHSNEKLWDASLVEHPYSSSNSNCHKDFINKTEASWIANGGHAGDLLEAVVANSYGGSDDTSSNRCNSFKSSTSLSGHDAASFQPQCKSEASTLVEDDLAPLSQVTSACISGGKSVMSTMIDTELQEQGYSHIHPGKGRKMSTVRRRARHSDNQRPRPRDRQLIQDRVKELRDLVPNGTKCSIDGLLDRTIKHMLYLRNVTEQAEKMGQWVHHEVSARKDWRSSEAKYNGQNGTSWAFEFGSEVQVCPIVVEDLAYPGHMLIEMLCNDHALFLEIAQVIRGLELTILNGVMESRSENTWAHFIVEACKGFHRLDIFWPLMQLLQRKRNPLSSKI